MNQIEPTSKASLENLLAEYSKLSLYPVIGAEIEFYLLEENGQIDALDLDIPIEREKGKNQFEVKTGFSREVAAKIHEINDLKKKIEKQALKQNMKTSFRAKPFLDQPGSALHIHLHLENELGENLYIKEKDKERDILLYSIGGLCATMEENMLLFAPYEEAYLRYQQNTLESPRKICWGGNNRSAAIRIPIDQKYNRRLEHRVSCADAEAVEVVIAILYGVLKGIKEKISPPEKIYGNAFLEQYNYPFLPQTIEEARSKYQKNQRDFAGEAVLLVEVPAELGIMVLNSFLILSSSISSFAISMLLSDVLFSFISSISDARSSKSSILRSLSIFLNNDSSINSLTLLSSSNFIKYFIIGS